jgi:hypothetical protein
VYAFLYSLHRSVLVLQPRHVTAVTVQVVPVLYYSLASIYCGTEVSGMRHYAKRLGSGGSGGRSQAVIR